MYYYCLNTVLLVFSIYGYMICLVDIQLYILGAYLYMDTFRNGETGKQKLNIMDFSNLSSILYLSEKNLLL